MVLKRMHGSGVDLMNSITNFNDRKGLLNVKFNSQSHQGDLVVQIALMLLR
jgi:hypothetical protein